MKKLIIVALCACLLVGCAPSEAQLQAAVAQTVQAFTAVPSNTAYPTLTPWPTYTPYPTQTPKIVVVTATSSPTPKFTPTITNTKPPTPTATNTPNPLTADKEAGNYLVGVDIAPGLWRNNGTSDSCYWTINDKFGGIINNYFGMGGGTMYIPAGAFSVRLERECGTWTYMGQ